LTGTAARFDKNDVQAYPVTMRDIARAAGVSVSAVSLAMKNSPKVSAERRKAILDLAADMGYRRDPRMTELMEHLRVARPHRSMAKIAMLVPEITREESEQFPPIQGMIAGVKELAEFAGFGVDLFFVAEQQISLKRLRSILLARGIKGLVVAPFRSGVAKLDFDGEGLCLATAGYSIIDPVMHRACPNYLQMMDELVADCLAMGYRRIGLAMTYSEGGTGHKLFTSSFLYYQSKIAEADRVPILQGPKIEAEKLEAWYREHQPEVVISSGQVYRTLLKIGLRIPQDVCFASIDLSEAPRDAAGADHRHHLVGREALKLVLTQLNLNLTGVPPDPKVVLVDSHRREGFSLVPRGKGKGMRRQKAKPPEQLVPSFRGFLD
jgi:DNA-binding LacI/PurR family transcriptional regulator